MTKINNLETAIRAFFEQENDGMALGLSAGPRDAGEGMIYIDGDFSPRQLAKFIESACPPARAGEASVEIPGAVVQSLAREPATADTMRWRCEGPRSTEDANNRNLFWVGPGRPVAWVTREAGNAIVAALSTPKASAETSGAGASLIDRCAEICQRKIKQLIEVMPMGSQSERHVRDVMFQIRALSAAPSAPATEAREEA